MRSENRFGVCVLLVVVRKSGYSAQGAGTAVKDVDAGMMAFVHVGLRSVGRCS